ncbi:MAG: hypothetical protein HYZ63_02990 [Candidatus Andersenbacteria bacterium]|nr:hypothetical protein [Candidatus Andersenbacteria bacterium]
MNTLQHRWIWGVAASIALGALLFVPTTYREEIRQGTDTYSAHKQIAGAKVVKTEILAPAKFKGAGFVLVNMKKVSGGPVEVSYFNSDRQAVGKSVIPPEKIKDDTFAWADIPAVTLPDNKVTIEIKAPQAAAQNPIGLRFDLDTSEPSLGISRQVPAWQQLPLWIGNNKDLARHIGRLLVGTLGLTVFLLGLQYLIKKEKTRLLIGIIAVTLIAIGIRIPLLQEVESVFGGDAFNYLFKAMAWVNGYDPLFADARKGPIYALALIPGLLMPDPLLWGKVVNIASAATASVLVAGILALLSAPAAIAIAGGLLVAVSRQLWWESVHSLGNVPFTALMLASIFFFIKAQKKKGAYGLGLLSALTSLTRYEGIVAAAVLMPAVWLYKKFNLQILKQLLIPFLLLLAIPMLMWAVTGQLGIRTWSDIEGDAGLGLARSIDDFKENVKLYRLWVGRSWVFTPYVGHQAAAVGWGVATAVAIAAIKRWHKKLFPAAQATLPAIITVLVATIVLRDSGDVLKHLSLVFTYVAGIGVGYGLIYFPRTAVPVLLIFISQSIIITAILPKDRYYIHLLPLLGLAVVSGIWAIGGNLPAGKKNFKHSLLPIVLASLLISIVYLDSQHAIGGLVEEYNQQSQETTVLLQAARHLRGQSGILAAASDYLPFRAYLTDARLKNFRDEKTPGQVISWLTENNIQTVAELNSNPVFAETLQAYPNRFTQTARFTTKFGRATVTLYEFK